MKGTIRDDPGLRIALVMSALTCGYGLSLPFMSRWLEIERGMSGAEIGAIVSAAQLVRILIGPTIAAWADGAADRRTPLRLLLLSSVALFAAFFSAHGFWTMFALSFVASALSQAIMPLLEGAALRAGQNGRVPYGMARAAASSSFIIGNVAGGALVGLYGMDVLVYWLLGNMSVAALLSFTALKADAPAQGAAIARFRDRVRAGVGLFKTPGFARLLFGVSFIQAAHAFYYSFSVPVWSAQDIPAGVIGLLWAFGVIVEVCFLMALPQVEKRISPETLIIAGGAASIVRWGAFALAPSGWVLWPLQMLHALTFAATHVGALRLIFRTAPDAIAGFGQTLYAALASGTLIGLATLLSGVLYDHVGAQGYLAMAAMSAIGLALSLSAKKP